MSDHLDHDDGKNGPKIDPRVDITDLYVFPAAGDPGRSVLIMNVNPFAPTGAADFATDVVYEILVDTDADALPDVAFRTTFATVPGGQTATVRRATGEEAGQRGEGGEVIIDAAPVSLDGDLRVTDAGGRRFFAGLRADPFFFDLQGYLDNLTFTGSDLFADKNVFAIALDVPNGDLGGGGAVGLWSRVLVRGHGKLLQIDRMGRPFVNVALTQGQEKNLFNQVDPRHDLALFVETFSAGLRRLGGDANGRTNEVARSLLPDLLPYDPSRPAGYPNGRRLADDVIDHQLALFTGGRVTTDRVAAHDDELPHFPFLGEPHRAS